MQPILCNFGERGVTVILLNVGVPRTDVGNSFLQELTNVCGPWLFDQKNGNTDNLGVTW